MELNALSSILWRERRLIELLVFKLGEEKLVLTTGRTDWLVHAAREVDAVAAELKTVEIERAVLAQSLGASLGLDDVPSLTRLGAAAPPPWGRILDEHRRALLELLDEIHVVARSGRSLRPGLPSLVPRGQSGSSESREEGRDDDVVAESRTTERDGEPRVRVPGTLDMIVEELRGLGAAAAGESGGSATVGLSERHRYGDGDDLARVVVGLQIEEIARADARPSPIRVIRASLVEFLR